MDTQSNNPARRWMFVSLVTAAIAISYFDRQTVSVAIAAIQRTIPISNQQFSYLQTGFLLSYAAMYAIGGRMLDKLGTRLGFLLIMLWWSVACMLHGLATSFAWLLAMRFLLGMGEGGAFPAATRAAPSGWTLPPGPSFVASAPTADLTDHRPARGNARPQGSR